MNNGSVAERFRHHPFKMGHARSIRVTSTILSVLMLMGFCIKAVPSPLKSMEVERYHQPQPLILTPVGEIGRLNGLKIRRAMHVDSNSTLGTSFLNVSLG